MTINTLNRRQLIAGTGALTVYLALPGAKAKAAIATQASRLALKPDQLATYISINQDGSAVGWAGVELAVVVRGVAPDALDATAFAFG